MTDPTQNTTRFYPWEEAMPDRHARPRNPFRPFEESDLEKTIPERFEEMVALYPDRIAARGARHELTYRALNELANRLAWAILSEGEGRAPMVALLCEHDAPAIAALMGIIKAGRAYVPLDAAYPRARLEYILNDSQADLIVADSLHLDLANELAAVGGDEVPCQVINVEALDAALSAVNPGLALSPQDYAYIIYTSGTTGRPKGVLGSHRQVLHFTGAEIRQAHICPEDRISMVASLCFSASLTKIFPALLSGALLCPFDLKTRGVEALASWLDQTGITLFTCVPEVFRHLCARLKPGQTIPSLRVIRLGGDRVLKQDVELYRKHFGPHCLFRVGYGATEAKLIAGLWLNHDSELPAGPLPVGYPDLENEILVLDPEGRPVDVGEVGQIAVKSRYLSPGYWRLPEQTRARFLLASEMTVEPGQADAGEAPLRVYMTGDLGRQGADGCLWHLGRADFQVKIRGYRVELEEIEAALSDLPEVAQAVVMAWKREAAIEPQLVAYLVPAAQPAPTATELRQALSGVLPDYMIPAFFVMLEQLPLNVNLKIDRQALPEPEAGRPDLGAAYLAPRNGLERELAQMWESVLDVEPIGVEDNFFELGGHSLLAVRLFALIAQRWGRELPLLALLQAPTVAQLAALLHEERPARAHPLLVPIQPGGTRLPFFCVIPPRSSAVGLAGLAAHLGPDQPVYGLQYHRLQIQGDEQVNEVSGILPSVQELAGRYIQELRTVQPEGPYALGGRCFGGTVAFEMAQQLLAAGQRVELLALIGSAPPTYVRTTRHIAERMAYHRRQGRLLPVLFEYIPIKLAKTRRRLAWRTRQLLGGAPGRPVPGNEADRYVPRVYAGRLTVFDTTEAVRDAWSELAAAGVDYYVIEGSHHDMFREPLVGELAARLSVCLDQALEKAVAAL